MLQDHHDTMLELERMKQLDVKALIIQRALRGYKYRYDTKKKNIHSDSTELTVFPSEGESS